MVILRLLRYQLNKKIKLDSKEVLMIGYIKRIFNGQWVQDIIDNFDPYHIHELTRIEKTKE